VQLLEVGERRAEQWPPPGGEREEGRRGQSARPCSKRRMGEARDEGN